MDERKMILKMIEEGKITADEGLALLAALEKKETKPEFDYFEDDEDRVQQERRENREQFNKFKEDFQGATEKIIASANKGATKLLDVIGKAVDKLQHMDLDFDLDFNLNGTKVTEIIQIQDFNPKQVQFTVANGSLRISPWEKDYAQIEANGVVSRTKDEAEARRILSDILEHQYQDDEFSFFVKEKKGVRVSLDILLPLNIYQSLHVYSNNGSIRLGDFEIQEVKLETTNGSIRLNDIIGINVEGQTSNGRIQLNQSEFKNCTLQTSNGSIHLKHVDIEECKCNTTNGSIQASGQLQELHGVTTNGSIRIEQNSLEKSSVNAQTSNGLIRVAFPKDTHGVYGELTTNHGQMNVHIPHVRTNMDEGYSKSRSYYFEQGEDKNHLVKAETNTGSIQIVEREAD